MTEHARTEELDRPLTKPTHEPRIRTPGARAGTTFVLGLLHSLGEALNGLPGHSQLVLPTWKLLEQWEHKLSLWSLPPENPLMKKTLSAYCVASCGKSKEWHTFSGNLIFTINLWSRYSPFQMRKSGLKKLRNHVVTQMHRGLWNTESDPGLSGNHGCSCVHHIRDSSQA